jgi:hypothetical protein
VRTMTITKTLYKFEELPADIQERIVSRWRDGDHDMPWNDEWWQSLVEFQSYPMPIKVKDWDVSPFSYTYVTTTTTDDDVAALSGVRAWKWLVNNGWQKLAHPPKGQSCPFTGYCGDENLLDPLRGALANPLAITSLEDVFKDACNTWAKAWSQDMEYWYSDECIREEIAANEYEFEADGTLA